MNQSYPHFEVLLIDDGSTDGTAALVREYGDSRVHYWYQSNAGVCAARNQGASLARYPWLVFLDSDDQVEKDWLLNFSRAIKDENINILFCSVLKIDKPANKEVKIDARDPYREGKTEEGIFLSGAMALKKELFWTVGGYDVEIAFSENTELSIRLRKENLIKGFTDKIGLHYFPPIDGGSRNLKNSVQSNLYILQKHKDWFASNRRVKQLYLQTIGVAQIRLGDPINGRRHLWQGWWARTHSIKALFRAFIGTIPRISTSYWKESFGD